MIIVGFEFANPPANGKQGPGWLSHLSNRAYKTESTNIIQQTPFYIKPGDYEI